MVMLDTEQAQACEALGSSVIVSASAGAGKTKVLVERLLKRCLKDHVPMNRIVAMTFTKAAAEEMKKRVASSLNEALNACTDEKEKAYIQEQIIGLSDAKITTIDSYCQTMIGKYYNVIGLDPAITKNVIDSSYVAQYTHEAFRLAIKELYEKDKELTIRLCNYFSGRPEDYKYLEAAIDKINRNADSVADPEAFYQACKDRYPHITKLSDLDDDIIDAFYESLSLDLENIVSRLETLAEMSPEKEEGIQAKKNAISNCLNALKDKNYSLYYTSIMNMQCVDIPTNKDNKAYKDYRGITNDKLNEIMKTCYEEKVLVHDANAMVELCWALVDLAKNVREKFKAIKLANKAMDFTDMERYLLDILNKNDGEIAAEIRSKYDEIMVDEFQDTSILQNSIVEAISNGNNVFRVGDVKQSIYRFRQAKPSLMRDLLNDPSQQAITLKHNFRSQDSIVKFNNMLFDKLMNVEGLTPLYGIDDHVSVGTKAQEDNPPVPVEFTMVKDDEDEPLGANVLKARWIAEKVLSLKEKENYKFGDIAVLVRSHNTKRYLRNAFDLYNVPYSIDERAGFFNSTLCLTILAICKYILDRHDLVSLLTIFKNYYGLKDEEVAKLKIGYRTIREGMLATRADIEEDMDNFKRLAEREGILAMLEAIGKAHHYFDQLSDREQANYDYLYQKIINLAPTSLYDLTSIMNEGTNEKSNEAQVNGDEDDLVLVTTIHASKGLQYKVVILWADDKNMFNEKRDNIMVHDDLLIGLPYMDEKRITRDTVQYRAVAHMCDKEDQEEFIRLFYVAATRAMERMFIVDKYNEKLTFTKLDRTVVDSRKGITGLLLAALEQGPLFKINVDVVKGAWAYSYLPKLKKYVSALPTLANEPLKIASIITPSETEARDLPALTEVSKAEGKAYGTRIHEIMAVLENKVWDESDLRKYELDESAMAKIISFGESHIYQECLKMNIHKEYPFFVIAGSEAISGTMDFLAEDEQEAIIIDFKTDHTTSAEIKHRYREQLNTYRRAVGILYPKKEIRVYAYSFYNDEFVLID